jgi:hypothetical protein
MCFWISIIKKSLKKQKKKEEEKAKEKELNELFKVAVSQPKVPVGNYPFSSSFFNFFIWILAFVLLKFLFLGSYTDSLTDQVLIQSRYCASSSKWGSARKASNASSRTIWMFSEKEKRLIFIVTSATKVVQLEDCFILVIFLCFCWFLPVFMSGLVLTYNLCFDFKKQWRIGTKRHWRRSWSQREKSISRINLLIL